MAAYAALFSLMHIINQIQHHPHPPISLDKEQVDSLTGNVIFLQSFLEGYSSNGSIEEDNLESLIADAAYAAEDVIESHIADQSHAGSTSHGEKISSVDLYGGLQKVIKDMDLIKKEAENIREKMGDQVQLHGKSSISTGLVGRSSVTENNIVVEFDVLNEVMDKLTREPHNLQIIPIVGMGGIGKTTLARTIYENPLIVQHFDICAWVTVSQDYSRKDMLQVLCAQNNLINNNHKMIKVIQLGEKLYKYLWGRRYLIVMDDIWRSEAWDEIKSFFPDNNNGSKIMTITRLSNLAFQLSGSQNFQMKFMDEDKSWNLLCKIVFVEEYCPSELQKIGKQISKNCRGLPLSIVVIGGIFSKIQNDTKILERYFRKSKFTHKFGE